MVLHALTHERSHNFHTSPLSSRELFQKPLCRLVLFTLLYNVQAFFEWLYSHISEHSFRKLFIKMHPQWIIPFHLELIQWFFELHGYHANLLHKPELEALFHWWGRLITMESALQVLFRLLYIHIDP